MSLRILAVLVLAATLGLSVPCPALAQDHDAHVRVLELNHGAKWKTDAPLRQGMTAMRQAVMETPPLALAERVEVQVAYIIKNCRLPADADGNLHLVIEQLIDGAEELRIGDGARGREKVVAALNAYGAHFDHPDWRPIAP